LKSFGFIQDSLKINVLEWVQSLELQDFVVGIDAVAQSNYFWSNLVVKSLIKDIEFYKNKVGNNKMLLGSV